MTSFKIQINGDDAFAALNRLGRLGTDISPFLQAIGEGVMERTKRRFGSASGPDGVPWRANARSTIENFIRAKGGYGKRGINKKGQGWAMAKTPLMGHTGDLARQFHVAVEGFTVTVSNSMKYAAMQQFGGKKAQFPKLWGDIPARPFLPVTAAGDLYPQERASVVAELNRYLDGVVKG